MADNKKNAEQDYEKTIRSDADIIHSKEVNTDDLDKTIRTDSKIISAQQEDDFDKTIRSNDSVISASKEEDDLEKTVHLGDNDVISSGKSSPTNAILDPSLSKKNHFELNEESYKIVKMLSQKTTEAQIYLVEKNNDHFVLKLYYPSIRPKTELLKILRKMRHENIIEVFSYGDYHDKASGDVRFYELMEFAEGGDVENEMPVKDVNKLKKIALDAASGINYCHKNDIIHRDIKPGNFFYKDKKKSCLLIADFGISSLLDQDAQMVMTKQDRSAIFAAPEIYHSIGGKVQIGKEIDYYSLGISILYLYLGDNPFKGESEFSLMGLKTNGLIPIPDSLPDDIKHLLKGLLTVNPKKRWGYTEVNQWYYGQYVEVEDIVETQSGYEVFSFDRNLDIKSKEEMATAMAKHPELAIKYLYSGRITKWLEASKDMPAAIQIEEICEKRFAKNQKSGLQAAIYFLDPRLPFIAEDGTECSLPADFASLFENDFNKYTKELQDKDHPFYLFLASHGQEPMAIKFQGFFKKFNNDIALLKVIYTLNPETPFRFKHPVDDEGYDITFAKDTEELESIINDYVEEGEKYLYNRHIPTWIEHCIDKNLAQKINEVLDRFEESYPSAGFMGARYLMNDSVDYWGLEKDSVSIREIDEIGAYIFKHRNDYKEILKDNDEWLYLFLEARGYKNYADFAKHQINMKKHKNKAATYNPDLAIIKIARGFGAKIPFTFKKGIKVYNIDELNEKLSQVKDEVDKHVQNPNSEFCYWLATFFHEDPFISHDNTAAYEKDVMKYIHYLNIISSKPTAFQKKMDNVKNTINAKFDNSKKLDTAFLIIKSLLLLTTVAFCGAALYQLITDPVYLLKNPMTGKFWKVSSIYYLIMVVVVSIFVLIQTVKDGDFSLSTIFIGGPIVGLMAGVIVYYLAYIIASLLLPLLNIIIIVIIAAVFIFAMYKMLINPYTNSALKKDLYDVTRNKLINHHTLKHTFSKQDTFKFDNEALNDYAYYRKKNFMQILLWGSIATIVGIAASYALYYYHPNHLGIFN